MQTKNRSSFHGWRGAVWAAAAFSALSILPASGQTQPDLKPILDRLDRLEEQNRALVAEVNELKTELASFQGGAPQGPQPQPTVGERLDVQENRTAELAQTKVEAAHRFPIRITGMALMNGYLNSQTIGGTEYPTAAPAGGDQSGGGTVRQTILGFDYSGPTIFGGGKVGGNLRLDLFGNAESGYPSVRLRTATLDIDWKTSNLLAGVDKPIISPREPDSLAQVGVDPLTGAGNLSQWAPQVRFQQDILMAENTGIRAQVGEIQTHELGANAPYSTPKPDLYSQGSRPGVEARVELFSGGDDRRLEIAGGFHHSVSHVLWSDVPSDVYSVDWLARPWRTVEFTGMYFTGQNVAPLGTGGVNQGFTVVHGWWANPIHSQGGWAQLTLRPRSRLWFNLFSGQQDDRNSDLLAGGIGKNLAFGANAFYRLAPNVLASLETSQTRTDYVGLGRQINNHYDLALAYLF